MAADHWTEVSPEEAYFQAALQLAQYKLMEKEIPAAEECQENEALDRRILQMIDARIRKRRHESALKRNALLTLKTVITLLLILNLGVAAAFALSSEFRDRVCQLFVTTTTTHSELSLELDSEGARGSEGPAPVPAYEITWLPSRNFTIREETESSASRSITYAADDGSLVILDVNNETVQGNLNTENKASSTATLAGRTIQIWQDEHEIFLTWQEGALYFVLNSEGLNETEALLAAMSTRIAEGE